MLLFYSYNNNVAKLFCVTDLRLVNGDDSSGELQFLSTSGWIPVCYTSQFNDSAADIACHQLGYPFAVRSSPTVGGGVGIGIIDSSSCEAFDNQYLFGCAEYQDMTCQARCHLTCRSKCLKHFYT